MLKKPSAFFSDESEAVVGFLLVNSQGDQEIHSVADSDDFG
jgi:hypothetical protein